MQRSYTWHDLERMRAAIRAILSRSHRLLITPDDLVYAPIVEDRLRTAIMGGVAPDDLEREAAK